MKETGQESVQPCTAGEETLQWGVLSCAHCCWLLEGWGQCGGQIWPCGATGGSRRKRERLRGRGPQGAGSQVPVREPVGTLLAVGRKRTGWKRPGGGQEWEGR